MKHVIPRASGLPVAWAALAITAHFRFRVGAAESLRMAVWPTWVALILYLLARWLNSRLNRGRILLDCGPYPNRRGLMVWAFVFGAAGGFAFWSVSIAAADYFGFSSAGGWLLAFALEVSWAAYWLILPFGRALVTDRGIWLYSRLLAGARLNRIAGLTTAGL